MIKILCSSGVFTNEIALNDHTVIIDTTPRIEADGFEIIFYSPWYGRSRRIASDIASSGVPCPVVHAEKGIGRLWGSISAEGRDEGMKRLEENLEFAARIGAERVVLHVWERPEGDSVLEQNIECYEKALRRAQEIGVALSAETIPTIVHTPLANIRAIIQRCPESEVTFDTEFLALHSELDQAFSLETLEELSHLSHVHVKDFGGALVSPEGNRFYLHPGEGTINFNSIISNLTSCGYQGAISLEASGFVDGALDISKVNKSLAYLRRCTEKGETE